MATIASNVQWGSGPKIYYDFSYEKKREGSTQYYNISVSCAPLTGSYFGYPIYLEIFLDGTKKKSYTLKDYKPSKWSSAITYSTGWLELSNKTSGTTALKIRVYSGMGSTRNATYGYSLAIDPPASTITCTTANIGSNPTIAIAKSSSSFTHSVSYAFGSLQGDIVLNTGATSITNWTIPEEFYTQIPNAKTGEGTLSCITYSGSTPIGTTTCKLSVTTDEQKCKPTVSGTVVDTNDKTIDLTGDPQILVKFCSNALCTIGVTLNKNAGSVKAKTINNIAVTDTLEIPNVETGTFDFYAKDSREYHNTDKVINSLVPYVKLTANLTAWRVDPTSGNARLKIDGNYFNGNFGKEDNTLTVMYRQGDGDYVEVTPTISNDNTYTVTVSLTDVDYTKSFTYEVVVKDELSSVTKTATIQKGIPVFDWGEYDFNFNVPVLMSGVPIADFIVEQGVGNDWAWRKWNSGIAECWRYYPFTPFATGNQAVTISYPFSFVSGDYPIVTATLGTNGTLATNVIACNEAGNLPNKENVCTLFVRGITNAEYTIALHIYAVGRWK